MAVSHQSGTILHHWNDPPTTTFTKPKSAASSSTTTISLGIPTPPLTPFQEIHDGLISGLEGLLNASTTLNGRNKEMIFTRIRGLIKSVEERTVSGKLHR